MFTPSLINFSSSSLSPTSMFGSFNENQDDLDTFLYPNKLEKNFPVQINFSNPNFDEQKEKENEENQLADKIKKFEEERDLLFKNYFNYSPKVQQINLKASKKIPKIDPDYDLNISYHRLLPLDKEYKDFHSENENQNNGKFGSLSSESAQKSSDSLSNKESKQTRTMFLDKDINLDLDTSWIKTASLEADEEYLAWLQDLPSAPVTQPSLSSTKQTKDASSNEYFDDDDSLMNDPLEEARRNALARQRELEDEEEMLMYDYPVEDNTPKTLPPKPNIPVQKIPSTAELSADWGLKDQQVVKSIRKFILGMQNGLPSDKRK